MASLLHIRSLRMASKPRAPARAEAVEILARGAEAPEGTRSRRIRTLSLSCWRPEGIGDWRHALTSALRGISPFEAANAEKFESAEGTIESSSRVWLLLDGDPVRLSNCVRVRIVPAAIEVATFAPSRAKLQHIPRMVVPEPT
jgi:hypothetical protein